MDRDVKVVFVLVLMMVMASAARAQAGLTVEIFGGRTAATQRTWWKRQFDESASGYVGRTTGDVTMRTLEQMRLQSGVDFEATEQGVQKIGNLGSDLEVISDTHMKAYGWCFRREKADGAQDVPEVMPDQLVLTAEDVRLTWFYAYAEYDALKGGWIRQCVPAGR